jgi:hypothetical protein
VINVLNVTVSREISPLSISGEKERRRRRRDLERSSRREKEQGM